MIINAETLIGVTKSDSCELGPRFLPKAFDSLESTLSVCEYCCFHPP